MLEKIRNTIDVGMEAIFDGDLLLWVVTILTFPAWFIPWMIGAIVIHRRRKAQQ